MKVTASRVGMDFKPITFTITVESLPELASLYARANLNDVSSGLSLSGPGHSYTSRVEDLCDQDGAECYTLYEVVHDELLRVLANE